MHTLKRILPILFLSLLALFLISIGLTYRDLSLSLGRRITYPPQKREEMRQLYAVLQKKFNGQPVTLQGQDSISLTGILIARPRPRRVFILCHGYQSSKERWVEFIEQMPRDTFLLIDFHAHGESGGNRISLGWFESLDVATAVDWLRDQPEFAHVPIIGMGVSMGAAALLFAAADHVALNAIICISPYACLDDTMRRIYKKKTGFPNFPFFYIERTLFRLVTGVHLREITPLEIVDSISIPTFFIHAADDPVTASQDSRQLFAATHAPKELWIIPGNEHGGKLVAAHAAQIAQRITAWLKQNL